MKIAIIDAGNRDSWDKFITSHKESNFLQSWDFYEFHTSRGNPIVRRIAINEKGNIIGAYAGVVEKAKRGRHLAIAGGPILDWHCKKLVDQIFDDIKIEGKRQKCAFIRIRPQLELSDKSLKLMRDHGFIKAPMYLSVEYAGILNLEKTEDEILAGASQGFRRKMRKAEKNSITVEISNDPEVMKDFCDLEAKHAKRQGYVPFTKNFLTKQFEAFAKNDEVLMYTAKKDGEILAMNFMIFYGNEASYHYGVSSDLGTKYSAAPLLHMKAIEEAKRRGIKRYNLWGIVGLEEKKHRFYGVSEFKRSFGCEELKYTPAHDYVINPLKYQLTKIVETARKKKRHV
ncbi:peptidoglycan bridge formation glycyltransferase FemA/FemB family protein [Candidatus Saccharibacteria bacterium]|nr:peptidoglycan bridge formation glycyltransferase FemA/FemB family protein [Candidatus Saccharibacteria bacterium]